MSNAIVKSEKNNRRTNWLYFNFLKAKPTIYY